jgi:CRISPR-associated endonuclease Csn1
MKKILGLDLGTNSIGWALVKQDFNDKKGEILGMGSRIIPMGQDIKDDFGKGNSISRTADRTRFRGIRRLRERSLLRRERLHRVLNVLGFLPEHYKNEIDFNKHLGQFHEEKEPKIAWRRNRDNKFEFLFQTSFLEMTKDFKGLKVPYDWTIYYLRTKAIEQAISKEELAWLILNFNKKRGYYQARGEENDENQFIKEFVISLKVVSVEKGEVDKKNNRRTWYKILLSNGWEYSATFTAEPKWENLEKEFLITEEYDEDGKIKVTKDKKTDTTGKEKRRISILPTFDEINLMTKKDQDRIFSKIKARTEATIQNSKTTVGAYIYMSLKQNPSQKINGKLVRTIERKFYKEELKKILEKQIKLQPHLFTDEMYNNCVRELYKSNLAHEQLLLKRDFVHLFLNDIIYYQRPLRSQKSTISNCPLEFRQYIKSEDGVEITLKESLKAVSKSNPYYQEFRIWQWIKNLSLYTRDNDINVTQDFLNEASQYEALFDFLNDRKEVDQKALVEFLLKQKLGLKKIPKSDVDKYRWNYVEDKKYPCNETKHQIKNRLNKVSGMSAGFLTDELLYQLWHIIYSVTDKLEFEKALASFAVKHNIDKASFVENFKNTPPFKSDYGAYSEKAIKKMLPLMRIGKYWKWETIDVKIQDRIDKILTGEFDNEINNRVREKAIHLTETFHFQGLPEWLAKYVVYGRHSESIDSSKWKSISDLEEYLNSFKQHSLRNPIVEQVVTETLRVVKDIWIHFGKGAENYFDEIHVELGREMKNTAEERKRLTQQVLENENTNARIKSLLMEMMNDSNFENIRPHSPMHQEIMKIYEEYAINSDEKYVGKDDNGRDLFVAENTPEDIIKISKLAQPTKTELIRYKLWLEQKYRSPYTGQMIPLSKLFTSAYEIEHIIPQSRYFDDSLSNKVICEAAVNKLKDKQLGLEFIKNHHGEIVPTGNSKEQVRIFTEEEYVAFVKENYAKIRGKRNKLLLDEIPDQMIERQINDTRYISKFIYSVLSNIVRSENNDDGVNSKNIIPGNGKITSVLRQDWGLNDVWNELILPRFERMNVLTKSNSFTTKNREGHLIPTVPLELSKGFQKKRIDHRHHALDALVIACATRDHVNLLNNQSAKSENTRFDLQNKLRNKEKWIDNNGKERLKFTSFQLPWSNFPQQAMDELGRIIVSFKQNTRVINKTKFAGLTYKESKEKSNNMNWAIRKPLHKDTVSGQVNLAWVKVPKGKVLTATRKNVDTSFDEKTIKTITDTGIQKILLNYLKVKGSPDIAFTPEGLDELNRNISIYNEGKSHQPIYKVRIFELGSKFALGYTGNKKYKFVEAAKGTNLFFAIYADENGKRSYNTIPLNEVIERQKQGLNPVPETNEKGHQLLFHLSPNDLVYVPSNEAGSVSPKHDLLSTLNIEAINIYKMVSCTGSESYFVRADIASLIKPYDAKSKVGELGSLNKLETDIYNYNRIKEVCIKLNVDRLGNVSLASSNSNNTPSSPNQVNEPIVEYIKPKLVISKSVQDKNEEDAALMFNMPVLERLKKAIEQTIRVYGFTPSSVNPNRPHQLTWHI